MLPEIEYKNGAKLIIISAPSGCGKGTVLQEFRKDHDVFLSVSCTTRGPREGEENGVHYHFLAEDEFTDMIEKDGFLEYAGYTGNRYGTPLAPLLENLAAGRDVFLEIETQGAFKVKELLPETSMIFILPPSVSELRRRLLKRGTETPEKIEKRVAAAAKEIERAYEYEYVMMNDDLDLAVADFTEIYDLIKSEDTADNRFAPKNENIKTMIDEVLKNA